MHREYTSAYPARLVIEPERVVAQNANRAVSHGPLDPRHFSPHPKNPVMLNFFKQLGRADELGSGICNVTKYLPHYAPGKDAQFVEGDTFETIIPYPNPSATKVTSISLQPAVGDTAVGVVDSVANDKIGDAVNDVVKRRLEEELSYLVNHKGLSISDLKANFGIERATAQRDMKLLRDLGWVTFVGSPKTGKYRLTQQGKQLFL